jgi:hypothetical protein
MSSLIRYNASTGFTYLERGYQTEAAANTTLDMCEE